MGREPVPTLYERANGLLVNSQKARRNACIEPGALRAQEQRALDGAERSHVSVLSPLATIAQIAKLLGGIPVWEVEPDSEAALAGVRFGDVILSVNGVATPTFQKFLAAGGAHLDRLEFEVFRDGKSLKLRPKKSRRSASER